MDDKIIQIMPAPDNLYAVYDDDGEELKTKIVCLALTNDGDVFMMDSDDDGIIREIGAVKRVDYK